MQRKRSPISVDQTSFMNLTTKRLKTDVPLSSREKKEKVGERIAALQQLVSPFGKTDMASVLLEAIQYLNFLHDQVKVLVAPYLYATMAETQNDGQSSSLEAQGLCVVPISLTVGVVSSNGADLWAPIKTGASNSRGMSSDEASIITL